MAANSITVKVQAIISAAMKEIGVLSPGEQVSNDDAADVLQKLQRLLDQYNAKRSMIYNVDFTEFNFPLNTSPVTIGPGGDIDVNQRPVEIVSASLILSGSTPRTEIPINVRTDQWWAANSVKNLSSTLPTDLYYSPEWGLGKIYLWPVPSQYNMIRLEMRSVFTQLTSYVSNFSMPPGYWDMVVYSLAESLCPMFQVSASADLVRLKNAAVKSVISNNVSSPRGITVDAGMPTGPRGGGFNYLTGLPADYNKQ